MDKAFLGNTRPAGGPPHPEKFAPGSYALIANANVAQAAFDGIVVVAAVLGNAIVFATTATGGAFQTNLHDDLATRTSSTSQLAKTLNISTIARNNVGDVTALVDDVTFINTGHVVKVAGVADVSFDAAGVEITAIAPNPIEGLGGSVSWNAGVLNTPASSYRWNRSMAPTGSR